MHFLDWTILLGTLGFIVGYGVWKTRKDATSDSYLRGGSDNKWWAVGLSVMATQASAITFLSTPGQGFLDGMGFIQFYFGLPLAMLVIGFVFIPLYYKWKVYTAYEFIGKRFDGRARLLTAGLFLIQRSLAAGITIYAPSIILSKVLHWPLSWTCVFIGALVILYTTSGGAKAVGVTQKQQMAVMFLGIIAAFGFTVYYLSSDVSFGESIDLAAALGKMDIVDTSWDPTTKYTLWSGLIGGFFLQLSYFGTDQSQVQRYLGGQNIQQARQGLWMNAALKIPMQFFILLTGVLVFVFYLFNSSPVHWNAANVVAMESGSSPDDRSALSGVTDQMIRRSEDRASVLDQRAVLDQSTRTVDPVIPALSREGRQAQAHHQAINSAISIEAKAWVAAQRAGDAAAMDEQTDRLKAALAQDDAARVAFKEQLAEEFPDRETNDKDYIFISFVMDNLPIGIVGLLLAMIFSAGMSSTAAELSALATTTTVDVLRSSSEGEPRSDAQQVTATKWATVAFGVMALGFAAVFSLFENLIQAVNILGSLFYGTILGIFLVAFFVKWVHGTAVFVAALIAQAIILYVHFSDIEIAFLWYNLIAPAIVVLISILIQAALPRPARLTAHSEDV